MSEITLPWPHRDLSPNARVNWKAKHRRRHAYKHTCSWACEHQRVRKIEAERVNATIIFHPPDRRNRDIDNMLGSIKAGLDAIAEAVGVDDSKWSISMSRAEPRKGGAVLVRLEAA